MPVETVDMATHDPRTPIPWTKKINPIWWLQGPDGWEVPEINNGEPYLPNVKNIWLRRFYWFVCRNPLMNFMGFVIGVEDKNYKVTGTAPVLATTGRDVNPPQEGWRWAYLRTGWRWLPYVSYYRKAWWVKGRGIEFYFGWRPHSGGFGLKVVFPEN